MYYFNSPYYVTYNIIEILSLRFFFFTLNENKIYKHQFFIFNIIKHIKFVCLRVKSRQKKRSKFKKEIHD